jgi:subtilisin family serine protease
MKIKVILLITTRIGGPGRTFQKGAVRVPGEEIQVQKIVTGENINGHNDQWFFDGGNNYYWSGGVSLLSAVDSDSNPAAVVSKPEETINDFIKALNIDKIWLAGETGNLATVAILDSGIALDCADLTNAVGLGVPGGFSNAGFRMKNFVVGSNTMEDDMGHGSSCAGLIASRNKNNIVGIAKDCVLYVGKISEANNGPSVANMIQGLRWAAGIEKDSPQDIDIISMSNTSLLNDPDMQPTIDEALKRNKILVFSIGNTANKNNPTGGCFPAIFDGTISVGAVDLQNKFLDFTYQYDKLTICCPGLEVSSYWVSGAVSKESGTSQATAVCAGIIALLVSALKKKKVAAIPEKIKELLLASESDKASNGYSYKYIDPLKIYNSLT